MKRRLLMVNLLLTVLVVALAASLPRLLRRGPAQVPALPPAAAAVRVLELPLPPVLANGAVAARTLRQVWEKNLFSPGRSQPAENADLGAAAAPGETADSDFELTGVITFGSQACATILQPEGGRGGAKRAGARSKGRERVYRVGDQLRDSDWKVASIKPGLVVLEKDGETRELTLSFDDDASKQRQGAATAEANRRRPAETPPAAAGAAAGGLRTGPAGMVAPAGSREAAAGLPGPGAGAASALPSRIAPAAPIPPAPQPVQGAATRPATIPPTTR